MPANEKTPQMKKHQNGGAFLFVNIAISLGENHEPIRLAGLYDSHIAPEKAQFDSVCLRAS